jgi:hypothetical protein
MLLEVATIYAVGEEEYPLSRHHFNPEATSLRRVVISKK